MSHPNPILTEVEAYLAASGMAPTSFGLATLKDRHFVRQLRGGRRLWPETEAKVREWMRDNPPVASGKRTAGDLQEAI